MDKMTHTQWTFFLINEGVCHGFYYDYVENSTHVVFYLEILDSLHENIDSLLEKQWSSLEFISSIWSRISRFFFPSP